MEKVNYENVKIAIIDDEEFILDSYKRNLEKRGFKVTTYINPIEALEKLKENDVDLILLDFYMPEKTGGEFAAEYTGNAVIILQTGHAGELPSEDMLDKLNIQGYFDKSKGFEELIVSVKSAVKTSRLMKEINELNYEEEFIGKLLVNVTDEMKEQLAVMAGPKMMLKDKADELNNIELKEIANKWQYSVDKIEKKLTALNFRTSYISTINDIFDTVKVLTLAFSSCIFKETHEIVPIQCNPKYLVYLLSEIIMYLYKNSVVETEILAKKVDESVVVVINRAYEYSDEIIRKLNNITTFDDNITINLSDNLLEIVIK